MSFTYTKEGIALQKRLNNKNWTCLHLMLHNFCYRRGYGISSQQYLNLYGAMTDDFENSRVLKYDIFVLIPALKNWFLGFLQTFDDLKITDIDKAAINKSCKQLEKDFN